MELILELIASPQNENKQKYAKRLSMICIIQGLITAHIRRIYKNIMINNLEFQNQTAPSSNPGSTEYFLCDLLQYIILSKPHFPPL